MSDIQIKMLPLPSVFLMEAEVPDKHVETLNNYLDNLLEDKNRKSAATTLVGQIQHGEQLVLDHMDSKLEEFRYYLQHMAVTYVTDFFAMTGQQLDGNRDIAIDELWSVHSYAGDYNPLHDHGTQTMMGISCTTWTKVPDQIVAQPSTGDLNYDLYNSSGDCDGYIAFNYGQSATTDRERLKPTQCVVMKPEVGKMYLFPSWLQHMVYPFQGEGERRTVAANLNAFRVENNE
mgnify:FL=1|tara:strand:+ start:54 stop:749 length:696 start_codon:yes stop_codon:yes gene_type:complete